MIVLHPALAHVPHNVFDLAAVPKHVEEVLKVRVHHHGRLLLRVVVNGDYWVGTTGRSRQCGFAARSHLDARVLQANISQMLCKTNKSHHFLRSIEMLYSKSFLSFLWKCNK
jgi:hypothetical protein